MSANVPEADAREAMHPLCLLCSLCEKDKAFCEKETVSSVKSVDQEKTNTPKASTNHFIAKIRRIFEKQIEQSKSYRYNKGRLHQDAALAVWSEVKADCL